MKHLCVHSDNIGDAYDILEIFKKHRGVMKEPEILFKTQSYNIPGNKRDLKKTYLTSIKLL